MYGVGFGASGFEDFGDRKVGVQRPGLGGLEAQG